MTTLADNPERAQYVEGRIVVHMASGVEISFPVAKNPNFAGASESQLSNIVLSPYGLHWPDLDEDLSIRGITAGDYGQRELDAA